jgi:single-strand DNA-binding protein
MQDVNVITLVGRLTRDPELRHTPSGTSICSLRLAFSTSRKDAAGAWTDKSNYVDVTVWGNQGEACANNLAKGRQVCVKGRLEWREWDAQDGTKRQAHEIVAEQVQFLGSKDGAQGGGGSGGGYSEGGSGAGGGNSYSTDGGDFQGTDDDIPF